MQDWIERYVEVTEGIASPEIFRLWAAIGAVAGSMERRLWATTTLGRLYANLYIMLVAPPGVGKTEALRPAETILKSCQDLNIAPGSMTKAAIIDTLRDSRRIVIIPDGILEYHSLQIMIGELGVLINSHDLELLAVINEIFDNKDMFRERRRHVNGGKEIQIANPQFNIIAGAQPALLSTILPEEAWGLGTTSRFIMVYAPEGHRPDIFGHIVDRASAYKELAAQMRPWTQAYGQFRWSDSAIAAMRKYYFETPSGPAPAPEVPKLIPYCTRRVQFLIKLAMISTLSRTSNIDIDGYDVERARLWLLDAEHTMPGIFQAMSLKTDAQLIEEMHIYAWREYREQKFVPLNQSLLHAFLAQRVYSERIPKIIEAAMKSRLLEDLGGGLFKPSARLDLGQANLREKKKS